MSHRPLVRHLDESLGLVEQHAGHFSVLGVCGVRVLEEHSYGEEGRLDRLDRRPILVQCVETDDALEASSVLAQLLSSLFCASDLAIEMMVPRNTYRLTADVGMPDPRLKLHLRRLERVLVGELDSDHVFAPCVRRVRGPIEPSQQGREGALVLQGGVNAGRVLILGQVLELLHDAAVSAGHGDGVGRGALGGTGLEGRELSEEERLFCCRKDAIR